MAYQPWIGSPLALFAERAHRLLEYITRADVASLRCRVTMALVGACEDDRAYFVHEIDRLRVRTEVGSGNDAQFPDSSKSLP